MIREICFIDDTIPAMSVPSIDDAERLNRSNLKLLLDEDISWGELPVKSLVRDLVADAKSWSVSAFTHPDIYLNHAVKQMIRALIWLKAVAKFLIVASMCLNQKSIIS